MAPTSPSPGASTPDPQDTAVPDPFPAFLVSGSGDGLTAGVTTLTVDDLPAGEVLIEVSWSAVNYKDGMVTRPGNRVARTSPLVPGVDLVGTVAASSDPAFATGDPVIAHGYDLGVARHGGFAQFARVPAGWVVPLPDGLTPRRAAVLGTAGFTAALSLHRLEHHGLVPGAGPVLVTGASGGVGGMAVALATARGYEVVASTGRTAERAYLLGLGAAEVIGRDDLVVAPDRTLGPERWAGAIDCVGGATLSAVLRTLRYGGAVAASGLTGGNTFESSVYPFIVRDVALLGIDTVLTPIEERRAVWDELAIGLSPEVIDVLVDGEVELSGLAPVLDDILAGRVRGRMLVRPTI
ncbi:MAG TPA: acryloyl-CoA reductase [Acidimicrobiales bacterium]